MWILVFCSIVAYTGKCQATAIDFPTEVECLSASNNFNKVEYTFPTCIKRQPEQVS